MPSNVSKNPFIIRPGADFLEKNAALKHAGGALAHKYARRELVTEAELQAVGHSLWRALDAADEFAQARAAAGVNILPIIVESAQAAVQQLPWETLYHPEHGFLARSMAFTLSRRSGGVQAEPPALETGPLRVLLFTSLPDDVKAETGRLDVEDQQAQVLEALSEFVAEGLVDLEMPDDGRFTTLQDLLQNFRPHLLYLFGHGKFYYQPHDKQAPFAVFQFEDDTGQSDFVDEKRLAQAFVGNSVACVALAACESGKTASDALNNGLAWRLSQAGVPHVIGMREAVLERAGILFNAALARAVAAQERIDVALQRARRAITTPLKDSPRLAAAEASGLAELSLGQWCLPLLLSPVAERPLINWQFAPRPPALRLTSATLQTITLPPRFLGRRSELRDLKSRLRSGELTQLLITGPGGQGKTALAGKLALDLQGRGYQALAWSARLEQTWDTFMFELELLLSAENAERYTRLLGRCETEEEKARLMLRLLLGQSGGRLLLFFDNLESLQDEQTLALRDATVAAWITAAQSLAGQGLIFLLTSRWKLPDWPEDERHWPLTHANYGDFLQMALAEKLAPAFYRDKRRLRRIYTTLHGNGRGLTLFAAAVQSLGAVQEELFLQKLAQAEADMQTDMALDVIVAHLSSAEKTLLARLPVYPTPVPPEGIQKLGLDLSAAPQTILQRLLAVSLVERTYAHRWQAYEYLLSPLVGAWLAAQDWPRPSQELFQQAAVYQLYLFRQERKTLPQALAVYQAQRAAGADEAAYRFALDVIVGPLNRQGLYQTLLDEWLPDLRRAQNPYTLAEAIGQTGKQHHHLGNYETALGYLERSLQIRQEIGDKAGEGTTLNNISQIYDARGDYETALGYLERSLQIRQEIGDKAGEGTTLNNISQIYDARGDYETALGYLERSLQIRQEIGDKAGEGTTLNNMATTAYARGDYETALGYLERSLQIRQEIGDKAGEGTTLNNISQIYDARGDYETALGYLERSLQISQEIGDAAGLCATLFNMGFIYWQNGEQQQAWEAWVTVYRLAAKIGLAQALQALENLAGQLGLDGGLAGWEALAKRMEQR